MPYKDKEKQRVAQHASYERTKAAVLQRVVHKRRLNQQWLNIHKSKFVCTCGEADLVCLELHHLDPTIKEVDIDYAKKHWSLARLKTEVAKCVVICSNCHKKLHWQNQIRSKRYSASKQGINQQQIMVYKANFPCRCGESDPACLEFHHTDPDTKIKSIGEMYKYPLEQIYAEIAKCIIICSNCHKRLHANS